MTRQDGATREYTVDCDGLALQVTEWGPPAGRPVVMLHGIRGYAATFERLAAALQPDWRVIAYDQRGRGRSDWDPARRYVTSRYVDDLVCVSDALGLDRFDVLGHSMGGIAAIVHAASYPQRVRRLVVEDAGPGAFEASEGAARIRRELSTTPAAFASWDEAYAFMRASRPGMPDATVRERLRNLMAEDEAGGGVRWRYDHAGIAEVRLNPPPGTVIDLWPHVAALACPTLVLRGARSDYLAAATVGSMMARNARIRGVEVADAGHYIHDDQPDAVARHVKHFLEAPAVEDAGAIAPLPGTPGA